MPSLILDWILHLNVIYLETFWAYSKVTWCRKLVVEKWCRGDLSVERSLFIHARPEQTPENRAVEIERGLVYKHFLNLVNKTSTSMTKGILSGFWWTLFYTKQIFLFSPIMGESNFILSLQDFAKEFIICGIDLIWPKTHPYKAGSSFRRCQIRVLVVTGGDQSDLISKITQLRLVADCLREECN